MSAEQSLNGRLRLANLGIEMPGPLSLAAIVGAVFLAGCAADRRHVDDAGARALANYAEKNGAAQAAPASVTPGAPPANRTAPSRAPAAMPPAPAETSTPAPAAGEPPGAAQPAAAGPATERPSRPVVKPQNPLPGFVDPLTRSGQRIPITLDACLRRALANNLTVQVARYGPPIARTVVRENEAMFDPSWFLNSAVSRLKQQAGNFFAGANVVIGKQWDFSTGLESLLPTGATVALTQDWTWQQSNSAFIFPNPQYVPDLTLSARQPLLRGGGVEVTTSPIVLARLDETISTEEFKLRLMDTILDVEMTYWNLVVAETQVQALNEAIDAARENLRIAQRRFEEGKDLRVVVSLAQSAVTSRQADLVAARLALARTSDRLKRLINDPQLPLVQPVVLAAAEVPMAEPAPVGLPLLHQSMVAAMSYRPELQQAEARVSKADIGERVAKNNRLPQLDFVAAYGLNGLGTHLDRGLDSEFTAQYYQWQAGVDFSVPIGNRARTAAYRRSQLTEEQSLRDREDVRQRVLLDVSDAVHNLAAAAEAILARRAAREAAEQTLKDEQAFVGAGAALLKDLLDAQRDLADAKVREMQAMANYMVGLAALERAKGTLLEYNNLRLVEESGGLPAAVRQPPAAVQQPPGAVQQPPAK